MLRQTFPRSTLPCITWDILIRVYNELPDNKSFLAPFAEYLAKDISRTHNISESELFRLLISINGVNEREQISLTQHLLLKPVFPDEFLFDLFKKLNKLFLINHLNLKRLYSLSVEDKKKLLQLLDENNNEMSISQHQEKLIYLFMRDSRPILQNLFVLLKPYFDLSKPEVFILFSLSPTNIERLYDATYALIQANLFTYNSYQFALQRITTKQPKVCASPIIKLSGKINKERKTLSSLTIPSSFTLFIHSQPSKCEGAIGKIKLAYRPQSQKKELSAYAIKKFHHFKETEKLARRGVRGNKLLGREAYYFSSKQTHKIISPWQPGKSLELYEAKELIKIPMAIRVDGMINGLLNLETLHQQFYIHGDVKPANFIINHAYQMNLIDFDGMRKNGSHNISIFTQKCFSKKRFAELEHNPSKQSFFDDVYAMGLTLQRLFPELYKEKYADAEKNKLPIVFAIRELIAAMLQPNQKQRCTIEHTLDYAFQVLAAEENCNLTTDLVSKIAAQTIYKNEITVEDVMRGRTCLRSCGNANS